MDFHIKTLKSVDSTNNYLKRLASESAVPEKTVILTEFQETGRGRGDHSWHSEPAKNLLMSVLLRPEISVSEIFSLSALVSLAITDMLTHYDLQAQIKWPNDIFLGDRKLAGILVENSLQGTIVERTIAGVGLNINQTNFPRELPNPVSMSQALQRELNRDDIHADLLKALGKQYQELKNGGYPEMLARYNNVLYRRHELHGFSDREGEFAGWVQGVKPDGQLVIKLQSGFERTYAFGELEYMTNNQNE